MNKILIELKAYPSGRQFFASVLAQLAKFSICSPKSIELFAASWASLAISRIISLIINNAFCCLARFNALPVGFKMCLVSVACPMSSSDKGRKSLNVSNSNSLTPLLTWSILPISKASLFLNGSLASFLRLANFCHSFLYSTIDRQRW